MDSHETMWLNEGLGCDVEAGFNYSKLCDNSSGCKSQEQRPKTLRDFYYDCYNCTITIVCQHPALFSSAFMILSKNPPCQPSSETSCKSTPSSSAALLRIVWVFLTGGVLLSFFFLIFTIHFRKNRIVKMSSPNLNVVTLLGSGLTYSSAYLFGLERQTPLTRQSMEMLVQVRICLLCIGMTLVFGPILGKSWRLYKVFTQQVPDKRVIIKDFQLLVMVAMLVLADVILLLIWIFTDPIQCLQSFNTTLKVTETGLTCTVNRGYFCTSLYSDLWLILFLGFKGILLLHGAYLAGLTDGVSSPPVNQSLSLIVGISLIFLSSGTMLVVNRFFHLWHNLVFGFASGGIFVCTATITCLIFIPQVRQWKAFEKEKDDISNMAKYFTSSSKNFHSTMYTDEEIYQLLGEKNSMMQLLAEKETAIASLQEQMNNAKEKLMRLVEEDDNYNAADSPVPYSSNLLQHHAVASCTSVVTSRALSSPGQELKSGLKLSDAWYSPGTFSKKEGIDYLDFRSQQNTPSEITARCRLLNESENTYNVSNSHAKDQWLSQYATTCNMGTQQQQSPSTLNGETQQPEFSPVTQKQFPGISVATNEKLQEILQELSLNHTTLSPISSWGFAQSPKDDKHMEWQPQDIQASAFTKLSPSKTRQEKKIPIHMPGLVAPNTWCMNERTTRLQRSCRGLTEGPWTEANHTQDGSSLYQPPDLSSLELKKMHQYKAENLPEHSRNERHGWLLDKHHMEDFVSTMYPGSPRNLHLQWKDFLGHTELEFLPSQQLYSDSDSASSFSGGVTCCHHSLSSSSDSCSTDTDPEHGMDLDYCATFYGKPRPIVNFIEDLNPIYV
ncbi:probable G-protein coupled receptor 156 [Tiliqua scincoides]|uniref:probable G-protein coupled receptor 156 n=1 Tax=Tiliqua scincoides TaxID=71010 RepID=UPI00346300CF